MRVLVCAGCVDGDLFAHHPRSNPLQLFCEFGNPDNYQSAQAVPAGTRKTTSYYGRRYLDTPGRDLGPAIRAFDLLPCCTRWACHSQSFL